MICFGILALLRLPNPFLEVLYSLYTHSVYIQTHTYTCTLTDTYYITGTQGYFGRWLGFRNEGKMVREKEQLKSDIFIVSPEVSDVSVTVGSNLI